jgi:hypothetical protein
MNAVRLTFVLAAAVSAPAAFAAPDIVPPKKRAETLALAQRLVHPPPPPPLPPAAEIRDPFNPLLPSEAAVTAGAPENSGTASPSRPPGADPVPPPRPPGDQETLETIANSLTPSFVVLGGERILIFGQSRKKAGDTLLVTYKDAPMEVAITAIAADGTFTLRLRGAEFQRPVKLTKSTKPSP